MSYFCCCCEGELRVGVMWRGEGRGGGVLGREGGGKGGGGVYSKNIQQQSYWT